LRYGEAHDHYRLASCLLGHHQRLDHVEKCSHLVRFLTISHGDHRAQTIYALSLFLHRTYLEPIVVKLNGCYTVSLIE